MKTSKNILLTLLGTATAAFLSGCGSNPSFSLLADENVFRQNSAETNGKIDVLWVIDNSGSMDSSQQNVANNMASFMEQFQAKGFDYQMAVTTTEAYKDIFATSTSVSWARFRDGTDQTGHTGHFVIRPDTPNLMDSFLINIRQGIYGSGDERAFQSMKAALMNADNAATPFPRPGAFLSVVLLSDEDDFSHDTAVSKGGQYSYSGLHTVDSYVEFLDQITGSSPGDRKYNFNSIAIWDQQCLDTLNAESPGRKIGRRYEELTDKTNGIKGSLCGNFAETLTKISAKIIELSTQFYLNREPNPDTIVVVINGVTAPEDELNGWTYNPVQNSIVFHGSFVPGPGAVVSVRFDPMSIK